MASGTEGELGEKLFTSRRLAVTVRLDAGRDGDGDPSVAIEAARGAIARVAGVTGVQVPDSSGGAAGEAGSVTFQVEGDTDLRAEVCRALVESGHDVTALNRAERGLERVFVGLVGRGGTWH